MTGSAREEAERLVVATLATVSVAADRIGFPARDGCACPVCRAVEALRDPAPELAERLATGAADLAEGVAGLLRALRGGRS